MKKILFIGMHRLNRSPSQRYRFEQYLDVLVEKGFKYDISPLISANDDQFLYAQKKIFRKLFILFKSIIVRLRDLLKASQYDYIFIQREAFLTGSSFFERQFSKSRAKVVYDFDDAIWLTDFNQANRKLQWLKNPKKIKRIIECSNLIVAGNEYLAAYARRYNDKVVVLPTTIDTDLYRPVQQPIRTTVCIGWTGSFSTIKHFELALPVLQKLKNEFKGNLIFKVIGDENYSYPPLQLHGVKWDPDREVDELSDIDIGIMPLPDNPWTRGKCGFKALQYMGMGIPAVTSPVGVNNEIIRDGVNGFLAADEDQWFEKLRMLVKSSDLRKQIGMAGRSTVEARYSKKAYTTAFLKLFS